MRSTSNSRQSRATATSTLLTFPPAKLNLGLFITGKRPDGFHALESVFLPIGWTDVLEVVASGEPGEVACEVVGRTVEGPPESNLVVRAYREVVAAADGDGEEEGEALLAALARRWRALDLT